MLNTIVIAITGKSSSRTSNWMLEETNKNPPTFDNIFGPKKDY